MNMRQMIVLYVFLFGLIPGVSIAQTPAMRVDVVVTAQTTTPVFYAGRALPSSGSTITATALPVVQTIVAPKNFSYIWKVNGQPQQGGIASRNNVLILKVADGNQTQLSVSVFNGEGKEVGNNTQTITLQQPEIHFYEVNPLQGQSARAVQDGTTVTKEDILLRAEPYFIDRTIALQNVRTAWELNNTEIPADNSDPYILTITKAAAGATARISFNILNVTNYLQRASSIVTLRF